MSVSALESGRPAADARELTRTAGSNWHAAAIETAKAARSEWKSKALEALTAAAVETWSKVLFPTPRVESWKYTNVDPVARGEFALPKPGGEVSADTLKAARLAQVTPYVAVVVDGVFRPELSRLPEVKGLEIAGFAELARGGDDALLERAGFTEAHLNHPFAALATALMRDGVLISAGRGVVVEAPIHVLSIASEAAEGGVCAPRLLVTAEPHAQLTIVQSFVSGGAEQYLDLPVTEIHAAEGANVDTYVFQNESYGAYHVSTAVTRQERASSAATHIFSFGGRLVRNNADALLHGSGATAVLNGLTVLSDEQHVDNATLIHHVEPSIESREHFKGIYAHRSKGVFSGTITVESEAQKTNAFQSNQALLLSPDAGIETRPQLKIWADDVKCTHGATVGQLDDEALFYLRSRGLDRETARNFLVHAFASEVLSTVKVEPLKEYVEGVLSAKLESLEG